MEVFSNMERFGYDPSHSQKRIADLNTVYSNIETVIKYATENNFKINVQSNIEMTFAEIETMSDSMVHQN